MKEEIHKLVADAVALHREIAAKTEQLNTLRAELIYKARSHPDAQVMTESGGTRWTAQGSDGCIARVNFPAAALIFEVDAQSEFGSQVRAIAGENFHRLFATVTTYRPVDDFRLRVTSLLATPKAEALMALCHSEGSPCVSFETTSLAPGGTPA